MKPIVFGTGVQGASHIRSGTECQDSHKKIICENGTVIIAVADGHGSKRSPFSKTGSAIAVNVFCKIMSEYVAHYADSPELLLTFLNREGDMKIAQSIDAEWKKRVEKKHRDYKRPFPLDDKGEKDTSRVYDQYGTTLLGLVLSDGFFFAFQIGDGDIVFVSETGVEPVVNSEKILGVETHSLCKPDAWKKAVSLARRTDNCKTLPSMFLVSTDGFANSYKDENEFKKTCADYFDMVKSYGPKAVNESLKTWLTETSEMGCGDDITVMIAYCSEDLSAVIEPEQVADKNDTNGQETDEPDQAEVNNMHDDTAAYCCEVCESAARESEARDE